MNEWAHSTSWASSLSSRFSMLPLILVAFLLRSTLAQNFKQLDNLSIAQLYNAFGPLPYTAAERASDPLDSIPSASLLDTILSLTSFPSETAVGGSATWRKCLYNASQDGVITAPFPDADRYLPYQAWAVANFSIHNDIGRPHILRCSDPAIVRSHTSKHNITHCPADVYEDGRALCSIRLYPGDYQIFVHLQGRGNHTSFSCNYFLTSENKVPDLLMPINDTVLPNVIFKQTSRSFAAQLAGEHISVTLMNTHQSMWATAGVAQLRNAPPGLHLAPHAQSDDHYPLPRLAPRQIRQLRLDLHTDQSFLRKEHESANMPQSVDAVIDISYQIGRGHLYQVSFHITLDVLEWRKARSYHFTYVDIDSSVQTAAVIIPKAHCIGAPGGDDKCAVLLSTHGAGVDATARAWTESYQTQNQSWVLLPTGRRKFGLNWEGPQMKSAITALKVFSAALPGVPTEELSLWKTRSDHWLQAGHSMGGHGALLLATHYPDMLAAALPAMGWLRLSSYGGGGFEEQLSYSDASARAMITVASAEFSADLYAENLLGIPFLARVGSDDDNVPPSNLRQFVRLLRENEYFHNITSLVNLDEVPGEGHWFDGVVDDDALQPFIEKHLSRGVKPSLPERFTLFTMNPASSGSRGGFSIISLEVVFQVSRLKVRQNYPEEGTWNIQTENVRRFRYQPVPGLVERPSQIIVDSSSDSIRISQKTLDQDKHIDFCSYPVAPKSGSLPAEVRPVAWRICRDSKTWGKEGSRERGPDTSGPAFQVLGQRRLVVVFPEGDNELQNTAVSYSNSLYLRGISARVTPDSNVSVELMSSLGDTNYVLLGGPNMNRMAVKLHSEGFTADVSFQGNRFCIAMSKCYEQAGTGIAFLAGGPKRTLLFYVAGTDREGMLSALSMLPYSPSSRVPEWIIVSKKRGWGFRGLGAVHGLGYWDREWKFEPRKSYPAEFLFDMKRSGTTCAVNASFQLHLTWWSSIVLVSFVIACIYGLMRYKQRLPTISYAKVEETTPRNISRERLDAVEESDILLRDENI